MTIFNHCGKQYGGSSKKLKMPYDRAIPLLGIYLKEWRSGNHKDSCTPMFIVSLLTIAKLCK
jgi:hypothetical protein